MIYTHQTTAAFSGFHAFANFSKQTVPPSGASPQWNRADVIRWLYQPNRAVFLPGASGGSHMSIFSELFGRPARGFFKRHLPCCSDQPEYSSRLLHFQRCSHRWSDDGHYPNTVDHRRFQRGLFANVGNRGKRPISQLQCGGWLHRRVERIRKFVLPGFTAERDCLSSSVPSLSPGLPLPRFPPIARRPETTSSPFRHPRMGSHITPLLPCSTCRELAVRFHQPLRRFLWAVPPHSISH